MSNLSAAAQTVLQYIMDHSSDGYAELNSDIGLPDHIVMSACRELKSCGKIRGFEFSDDSVELVRL